MEIAARENRRARRVFFHKHKWIVGDGHRLGFEHAPNMGEHVARRPVDLRHTPQTIRVLDVLDLALNFARPGPCQLAAFEVCEHRSSTSFLTRTASNLMDSRVERIQTTSDRLKAHCPDQVRNVQNPAKPRGHCSSERGHRLGPIQKRKPFFIGQTHRLKSGPRHRLSTA